MRPKQVLPFRVRENLGVMAIMGHFIPSRDVASLLDDLEFGREGKVRENANLD